MATPEEVVALKEQTQILKRKRTKRQRLPLDKNTNPNPDESSSNDTTEEEEDTANCLILLAQGRFFDINKELPTFTTGAASVYRCKTCDRAFPSFQALGGHRASHKKPKGNSCTSFEEIKIQEQGQGQGQFGNHNNNNVSSISLQLISNNNTNNNSNMVINKNNTSYSKGGNKVHGCGICGAEFSSGQALGGHMRRHRGPVVTSPSPSPSPAVVVHEQYHQVKRIKSSVMSFDLDLNLPAPEDEEDGHDNSLESGFVSFASKQKQEQQQQRPTTTLVFSSPALVDCHY